MQSHDAYATIIGFHVLSNGIFIKVHENLKIEIVNNSSSDFIEIKTLPASFHEHSISTLVAELPNQQIALAYCQLFYKPSILVILDLKSGTCIAQKEIREIKSLSGLPSENALFINSELICSLESNRLSIKKDPGFANFSLQLHTNSELYQVLSDTGGKYHPLPNGTGFIYYDDNHQSTLKLLSKQLTEQKQLRLCFANYDPFFTHGWLYKGPSYHSAIKNFTFFSDHAMACITEYLDRFTLRYESYEKKTYYLHILQNNLTKIKEINLHHLIPQQLLVLNHDYIAVIGYYEKFYTQIAIKIYDARGQQIKKFTLDKSLVRHCNFMEATPDGRIVTCSKNGEIIIHHVLTLHEKLQKETHAGLDKFFPKVLIPIVTDYAGFSSDRKGMPKNKFIEKNYPDENSKPFTKWRP